MRVVFEVVYADYIAQRLSRPNSDFTIETRESSRTIQAAVHTLDSRTHDCMIFFPFKIFHPLDSWDFSPFAFDIYVKWWEKDEQEEKMDWNENLSCRSHLAEEEKKSSSSATAQSVDGDFSQRERVACCLRCEEFESCEGAALGWVRKEIRIIECFSALLHSVFFLRNQMRNVKEHETSRRRRKSKTKAWFFPNENYTTVAASSWRRRTWFFERMMMMMRVEDEMGRGRSFTVIMRNISRKKTLRNYMCWQQQYRRRWEEGGKKRGESSGRKEFLHSTSQFPRSLQRKSTFE